MYSLSARFALRAISVATVLVAPLADAGAQTAFAVSGGYIDAGGDGSPGGFTTRLTVAPFRTHWATLGIEIGFDGMGLRSDSGPSGTTCLGNAGEITNCSGRLRRRERVLHVAAVMRLGGAVPGLRPTGEFGLGYYHLGRRDQQDTWDANGVLLPHLSSPETTRDGDPGLGIHGRVGLRYQPGASPFAVTFDVGVRGASFHAGDLEFYRRDAVLVTLGVAWN